MLDLNSREEEFRCYLKFNRKLLKEAGEEHDLVFIFLKNHSAQILS